MGSPAVKVSVVIVSWNRCAETLEAIRSALLQRYEPMEVVVVEAASTDGSAEAISSRYPTVRLVRLEKNRGVPGNRNVGASVATGDVLFFLDNDAELETCALKEVARTFEAGARVGAVGCRVLDARGEGLDRGCWVYPFDPDRYSRVPFYTYTFAGGAAAVRRTALEEVGPFMEELFYAREEEELCLRLLDAGFEVVYLPTAIVRHKGSALARTDPVRKSELDLRNMIWVTWRLLPTGAALRLSLCRAALGLARAARAGNLSAALRGGIEALRLLPRAIAGRAPIRPETYRQYLALNPRSRVWPLTTRAPVPFGAGADVDAG